VSAQQTFKQTDKVMKRAQASAKAIEETKAEVQKALTSYNSMFEGSAEPRKAYKDTVKSLDRAEKKAENVRKKMGEMETEADKYFGDWTTNLDTITNEDLKRRGEERRDATKGNYEKINTAVAATGKDFDQFISEFRDQLTVLGSDLNPSALSSFKGDAAKLNTKAAALFQDADKSLNTINGLIGQMAPSGT
jgi:uncharacterized protein YukE